MSTTKTGRPKPKSRLKPAFGRSGTPKKRTKRPTCRQADTFPCGYTCKNRVYRDRKTGEMKETQCGNKLKGQADNLMQWQKKQQERIASGELNLDAINAKRRKAGLTDAKLTPAFAIDAKPTKMSAAAKRKLQLLDREKLKAADKVAKAKEVDQPIADAVEEEKTQRRNSRAKSAEKPLTVAQKMRQNPDQAEAVKSLTDKELDTYSKVVSKRTSAASKKMMPILEAEAKRRKTGKDESKSIERIVKPTVTDRADLLPRWRKSSVPKRHMKNLYPVQQEGVARAIEAIGRTEPKGGFLLADGTGMGKTRQQLAIADHYASIGKKVLIVSPNAVLKPDYKGDRVLGSFNDDGQAMDIKFNLNKGNKTIKGGEIHLATYESIEKLKTQVDKDTVLIFDEAHAFKNLKSNRSQHGFEMLDKAGGVLYATATPADKVEHLAYLHRADVLSPGGSSLISRLSGFMKVTGTDGSIRFVPKKEKAPRGSKKKEKDDGTGKAIDDAMKVSDFFDAMAKEGKSLRREISMKGVGVTMSSVAVPEAAHDMMNKIEARFAGEPMGAARSLLDKRRQLEPFKVPEATRLAIESIKKGNQVVIFADRINESNVSSATPIGKGADGEPVFAKVAGSEGTIKLLRKQLESQGINPEDIVELHGSTKSDPGEVMKNFQSGKVKVLLTTPGSGGTGISLDDNVGDRPRTLISMTPPFSANEFMQMIGRVWRTNTNSIPEIHALLSDTSIDEWNRVLLRNKLAVLGASVGGAPKTMQFQEGVIFLRKERWNPILEFAERRNRRGFYAH